MGGSLPLLEWINSVRKQGVNLAKDNEFVVLAIIGKDTSSKSKCDDVNNALKGVFLSSWRWNDECNVDIDAYFSLDLDAVVLIVNSYKDTSQVEKLMRGSEMSFFDSLTQLEWSLESALLVVFSLSHLVLFIENGCRLELSLPNLLSNVNQRRSEIMSHVDDSVSVTFRTEGRFAIPRFLFLFHRNLIRCDLGVGKRKELLDKLQQTLEDQTYTVFKHYKLLATEENDALGHIWGDGYVFLVDKSPPEENVFSALLASFNGENEIEEEDEEMFSQSQRLFNFLKSHVKKVRDRRKNVFELPSQVSFLCAAECLSKIVYTLGPRGFEEEFIKKMTVAQSEWAKGRYYPSEGGAGRILSRAEHEKRIWSVIRSLKGVEVIDSEWNEVRDKCEELWSSSLRGCEALSLSGLQCRLPAHACVGNSEMKKENWQLHSSATFFVSACNCGRNQIRRRDPFTLREANYDFYCDFVCCKGVYETHQFMIAGEGGQSAGDLLAEEEEWPEARIVGQLGDGKKRRKETIDDDESIESDDDESEMEPNEIMEDKGGSYLDEETVVMREPKDEMLTRAIDHWERSERLAQEGVNFTHGVAHCEYCGIPPLFPSWSLVCIGTSSYYSHTSGIRGQRGFIGDTHLLPLDVYLEVDALTWARDMKYVESTINTSSFPRNKRMRKAMGSHERVKLFVGVEYECNRGHRQLILPQGEGGASSLVENDLPIFQQCAYRKNVCDKAQLMRLHVVTPKAPVTVTCNPKVVDPLSSGLFCTGESPLQLAWSRYYILRLPWAYGSPNGIVPRPPQAGGTGVLKGGFLSVSYTPLANWM